jgi:ankyrin repeat protein
VMGGKLCSICLVVFGALTAAAQEPSDRFYQAIRNNDLTSLRDLVKTSDVNSKDQRESTPLMYAAAYGSIDAMQLLLGAGADVNAKNTFDVTALMWCANDFAKVRLLVEKGANVNVRSKQGRTPLMIAAAHDGNSQTVKLLIDKGADVLVRDHSVDGSRSRKFESSALLDATDANDTASVRLLIEKGADVNAKNLIGDTPLMNAAGHGNLEVMKILLAKGADVNAVDAAEGLRVKNGPIALGSYTPLLFAVTYGGEDAVKLLLEAGAKVNVQDARGMTPLMMAIATDRVNVRVVRLLLDKGANLKIKSKDGETAVDWANKFNYPPVLDALGIDRKQVALAPAAVAAVDIQPSRPKQAAEKSIALLQRTGGSFMKEGGCVSCHAQNLTGLAVSVARANGIKVDEAAAAEHLKSVKLQWAAFEQVLLQRMDPPGAVDTTMYSLLHLAGEGAPSDHAIDALIHNMVGQQRKEGNWHATGVSRPPLEDGDFSRTALSIRALSIYGPAGRKAEFDERIQRAAAWLKAASPRTTEDRNMQLLGLKWANADHRSLEDPFKNLIALQRSDGGWAQTPELASDAYATATALYAMHEVGMPSSDPAYGRGVAYLLRTQLPDGSWHVASRAPKFQPYFQSGFPHNHDQWISSAATAWGAIALSYAVAGGPARVALK